MPNLNFTTEQAQRVQEAVAAYNARTGETLTPKQWVYGLIRVSVRAELSSVFATPDQADLQTRIENFLAQLETDMEGTA